MALIKCPECGKEISDSCDKCIHCGYFLGREPKSSAESKRYEIHTEFDRASGNILAEVRSY